MHRRVLLIVGLACVLAACGPERSLLNGPDGQALTDTLRTVRRELLAGHFAAARSGLGEVLDAAPGMPVAVVLESVLELDEGHLDRAKELLAMLRGPHETGEVRVLDVLIDRRAAHPGEGWRVSQRAAWSSAGRPDLGKGDLRPLVRAWATWAPRLTARARSSEDPRVRVALALAFPNASRRSGLVPLVEAAEASPGAVDTPGLALAVLDTVGSRATARRLARAWRNRFPEIRIYLDLWDRFGDTRRTEPLAADDVDALDRISRLPAAPPTLYGDTAEALRRIYRSVGLAEPVSMAMGPASGAVGTGALVRLEQRANVTPWIANAPTRLKLAGALWRLGRKLTGGHTVLEKLEGAALCGRAARLAGDSATRDRVATYRSTIGRSMAGWNRAQPLLFPIPALEQAGVAAMFANEFEAMRWTSTPPGQPEPKLPELPPDPFGATPGE